MINDWKIWKIMKNKFINVLVIFIWIICVTVVLINVFYWDKINLSIDSFWMMIFFLVYLNLFFMYNKISEYLSKWFFWWIIFNEDLYVLIWLNMIFIWLFMLSFDDSLIWYKNIYTYWFYSLLIAVWLFVIKKLWFWTNESVENDFNNS